MRSLCVVLSMLAIALASGGCSMSYHLGSLFDKGQDGPGTEATGSVAGVPLPVREPDEADLAFARAAAAQLLKRAKDTSLPWENPRTGARGTVTPIASAYDRDGITCRDFLASYVREGDEAWLEGEACLTPKGQWEVRSLKSWKDS